jgi:uncharacterized protein DUF1236
MKRTFMIGVAAGALLAGVNIAASQGTMSQQPAASGGGANMEQQKSGTGAQQPQGQRAQDAQKQGDQKQDAQKQGDQKATSGQAQQGQQGQRAQDAQKQGDQKQGDQKQDAQKQGDAKSGDGGKTLSAEQKTKVRETVIRSSNAPRVTNVNFSVSVGTVIPASVHFVALPPVLVEIFPEWSGYDYIIVDERIVILEPQTRKIVTILVV